MATAWGAEEAIEQWRGQAGILERGRATLGMTEWRRGRWAVLAPNVGASRVGLKQQGRVDDVAWLLNGFSPGVSIPATSPLRISLSPLSRVICLLLSLSSLACALFACL